MGWIYSAERLNSLLPTSVVEFQTFEGPKFFLIHYISMDSTWFSSIFLSFLKFPQIKEVWPNFLGESFLQNGRIICSPLLYFNLKHLNDLNSSWFIRFQCILHDSSVFFSAFQNFLKLKREGLNFLWGTKSAERLNNLLRPSVFQN